MSKNHKPVYFNYSCVGLTCMIERNTLRNRFSIKCNVEIYFIFFNSVEIVYMNTRLLK